MKEDIKSLDTLSIYKHALEAGSNESEALQQAYTAKKTEETLWENLKEYIKEIKSEYASQRTVSAVGSLILAVAIGITGVLWVLTIEMNNVKKVMAILTIDVGDFKRDLASLSEDIHEIKDFMVRKK